MKVKGSMNLFAMVERLGRGVFQASLGMSVGFDTPVMNKKRAGSRISVKGKTSRAVSYTHLTLPTICSV